jgi:hypothetical protein
MHFVGVCAQAVKQHVKVEEEDEDGAMAEAVQIERLRETIPDSGSRL